MTAVDCVWEGEREREAAGLVSKAANGTACILGKILKVMKNHCR